MGSLFSTTQAHTIQVYKVHSFFQDSDHSIAKYVIEYNGTYYANDKPITSSGCITNIDGIDECNEVKFDQSSSALACGQALLLDGLSYTVCSRQEVDKYYETVVTSCPKFQGARVILTHEALNLYITCPSQKTKTLYVKTGGAQIGADCAISKEALDDSNKDSWGVQDLTKEMNESPKPNSVALLKSALMQSQLLFSLREIVLFVLCTFLSFA